MAKKRSEKVPVTKTQKKLIPMRFMVTPDMDRKLGLRADELGLSKSSYAKMLLLERLKADDEKGARK